MKTLFKGAHAEIVSLGGHELLCPNNAVAAMAINSRGNALLVRQHRPAAGMEILEVPAGKIDDSEGADAAIKRELMEELGFETEKLEFMALIHTSPGTSTEVVYLYVAHGDIVREQHPDDKERIEIVEMNLDDVTGMIQQGLITDAKSLAALLLLAMREI